LFENAHHHRADNMRFNVGVRLGVSAKLHAVAEEVVKEPAPLLFLLFFFDHIFVSKAI